MQSPSGLRSNKEKVMQSVLDIRKSILLFFDKKSME